MGWTGVTNGELLARAELEFDVLVTADQQLTRQQKLQSRHLAIVVLPTNRVPDVLRFLPNLERVLETLRPGMVVRLPSTDSDS